MMRPFRITLIALGMLSLAAFNAWRAILVVRQLEYLRGLSLEGPALVLALTGLGWAAGFGVAAIGLYRLRRWARLWTMAAIVLYQANLWLVRLVFEKSPDEPVTRPADAALAVLSIAVVWGVLSWPSMRRMFA
jgi:hypothetical protein